ncbi:uncharacterized protein G2W53_025863 [Senna tora]|uniref:Uncharacterized protein n=1 Tax=Senna tora TaxID=362788 RepID=A0A834TE14_9FABA|nr:uncharacterized protein G2W53_025863 [Senna tora]
MGTKEKVKLEYITDDDDKTKVSFKKREGGLSASSWHGIR